MVKPMMGILWKQASGIAITWIYNPAYHGQSNTLKARRKKNIPVHCFPFAFSGFGCYTGIAKNISIGSRNT
jgi:hypothetical protein